MVVFDELRITEDGKQLIISCHIRRDFVALHNDAKITSIKVCDSSKYVEGTNPNTETVYTIDYNDTSDKSAVYIVVDASNPEYATLPTNFSGKMLFIYVETNLDESQLPCSCSSPSIGIALDMSNIYREFMQYIDTISCEKRCGAVNNNEFTDFILRYNAMILALDSKHYKKGIQFFDKWFNSTETNRVSNCGCNG